MIAANDNSPLPELFALVDDPPCWGIGFLREYLEGLQGSGADYMIGACRSQALIALRHYERFGEHTGVPVPHFMPAASCRVVADR